MIRSVKAREYYYECGDGCCTEWGVEVWIEDDAGNISEYKKSLNRRCATGILRSKCGVGR